MRHNFGNNLYTNTFQGQIEIYTIQNTHKKSVGLEF